MRFLFCMVVSFIISLDQLAARCADFNLKVYPQEEAISQNPVFLLEFDNSDFQLGNKLDRLKFYLFVNKERLIEVKIIQKIEGVGSDTQLLLKPDEELGLHDSVQFKVIIHGKKPEIIEEEAFHVFANLGKFQAACNRNWWKVMAEKDRVAPEWLKDPTWKFFSSGYTISEAMYGIGFTFQLRENNEVVQKQLVGNKAAEYLFEVEMEGVKFLCLGTEDGFGIYSGDCGSNFPLQVNKNY